jgi:hypothetical protein
MKTSGDAGKIVWNNKGAIGVATVATVALTNPEAATAAIVRNRYSTRHSQRTLH